MRDLTVRLRQANDDPNSIFVEKDLYNVCDEAADEIERLREWIGYIANGEAFDPQESALTCVMGGHLREASKDD